MVTITRTPRNNVLTRTNECTNPSFETGTAGWSALWGTSGAGTLDRRTDSTSVVGTAAARMTWTTAPTGSAFTGFVSAQFGFPAGQVKSFRGALRPSKSGLSGQVLVRFYDSASAVISTPSAPVAALPAGAFTAVSGTFTAPAGAVTADVRFVIASGGTNWAVNDWLLLDTVLIETTAVVGSYFDGSWGATAPDIVQWTGTAHASSSQFLAADPASYVTPLLVLGWDQVGYDGASIVHRLLSGAVQVVTRKGAPRAGTLRLFFGSDRAGALSCATQHRIAGVWAYRDGSLPETNADYVVTGPVHAFNDDGRKNWTVEVPFTEAT